METHLLATDALKSVQQSSFLSLSDWHYLETAKVEFQDTFEKQQRWRTDTEMRVSVLNDLKHPTPAAKYWQAVREQGVFFEQLVALSFEYRRNQIEIQRLTRDMEDASEMDDLDLAELKVDLDEMHFKRRSMELAAKDRVRELRCWSAIKDELDDGSFDTEDVNAHQLESYGHRFANQVEAAKVAKQLGVSEAINVFGLHQTTQRHLKERSNDAG